MAKASGKILTVMSQKHHALMKNRPAKDIGYPSDRMGEIYSWN
jgi:hypothetical protein